MGNERAKKSTEFAELLDSKFTIPGTNIRFGIDPLLGLIPGAGDWLGGVLSLYFLIQAALLGGKASVLGRMFINILMDLLIGSIPILGEFFDVYWKANVRNAKILDELHDNPEKTITESRIWIWIVLTLFIVLILGVLWFIGWVIAEVIGAIF